MILLNRLNGQPFALNPDLLERAEATPDTVITLVNGAKYVVAQSLDELAALVSQHRALILGQAQGADHDHGLRAVPGHGPGPEVAAAKAAEASTASEATEATLLHLPERGR
ncbi:flagellar FlbD family protein [Actinokineospora auranticolor]|uniref:Flagellar protein FlbD n=1 Tax=Actinokineospora auranticolor TaxID=155976 RepID=A0A2S6GMU4_9PSEU|nr:flagellar FlbD family protein [Actinokineospora auranticolor]PPK66486.1 flagellar protein FlbD [Actinokineospora auranticolor]